ncbi:MAG TPA: hypothetical protein VGM63_10485, partial [Mucilaginibacter sp.]
LSFAITGCRKYEKVSYSGVFRLDKQTVSGGGRDTVLARKQVKIYTDHNYMYAGMDPDSTVVFGVGSYGPDTGNTIAEHNIYNNRALDSSQVFVVKISKTPQGRTQVIPDFGRSGDITYTSTEEYTRLPTVGNSELDGVWSLDKAFKLMGKDTTPWHETQFKVYWGGHFMLIRHYPVNAVGTEYKNGFGYGTFSLKNSLITESNELSSHAELLNNKQSVRISFKGKDEFTQVTTDPKTNGLIIEIYERLL